MSEPKATAEPKPEIPFDPCLRCDLEGFEALVLGVSGGQALVQVDYDAPFAVPIERFAPADQAWIRERMTAGSARR